MYRFKRSSIFVVLVATLTGTACAANPSRTPATTEVAETSTLQPDSHESVSTTQNETDALSDDASAVQIDPIEEAIVLETSPELLSQTDYLFDPVNQGDPGEMTLPDVVAQLLRAAGWEAWAGPQSGHVHSGLVVARLDGDSDWLLFTDSFPRATLIERGVEAGDWTIRAFSHAMHRMSWELVVSGRNSLSLDSNAIGFTCGGLGTFVLMPREAGERRVSEVAPELRSVLGCQAMVSTQSTPSLSQLEETLRDALAAEEYRVQLIAAIETSSQVVQASGASLPVAIVVEKPTTDGQSWLRLVPWASFTSRHTDGEIGYDFAGAEKELGIFDSGNEVVVGDVAATQLIDTAHNPVGVGFNCSSIEADILIGPVGSPIHTDVVRATVDALSC